MQSQSKSTTPRAGAAESQGRPPAPRRRGFLEPPFCDIDLWLAGITARAVEREIETGELVGDSEPETPERNGIGGTFGPGGGR